MGYSEIYCKLCAVSFNIGRIRRADEPYDAGWTPECGAPGWRRDDFDHRANFVSKDCVKRNRCTRLAGCGDVKRTSTNDKVLVNKLPEDFEVDSHDEYAYESEDDGEPLEYESGSESIRDEEKLEDEDAECVLDDGCEEHDIGPVLKRKSSDGDLKGKSSPSTANLKSEEETFVDRGSEQHRQTIVKASAETLPPGTEGDSSSDDGNWNESWRKCQELEHLAGSGCVHHGGYSGSRITAQQMKGCTTSQCLVRKSPEWLLEPDDQRFELAGDYFLSGLSGHMPSRDSGGPEFVPIRHGVDRAYPDNCFYNDSNELNTPMPFHPTCFEIFTRASRLRNHGLADINGLAGWRRLESDDHSDDEFPCHPAARRAMDQWWFHVPGDEWLAANPVLVPLLPSLLRGVVHTPNLRCPADVYSSSRDPFTKIPREISDAILDILHPTDRASLRLASCATHLPISYWRQALEEEMSWLWEIRDTAEPSSFWATTPVSTLVAQQVRKEAAETLINEQRVVIEEEMPEILEAWCSDQADYYVKNAVMVEKPRPISSFSEPPPVVTLPPEKTNWCRLYYEIKKHWSDFPGLQNRQRIWTAVEEILTRIQKYRGEGRIEGLKTSNVDLDMFL